MKLRTKAKVNQRNNENLKRGYTNELKTQFK